MITDPKKKKDKEVKAPATAAPTTAKPSKTNVVEDVRDSSPIEPREESTVSANVSKAAGPVSTKLALRVDEETDFAASIK